MRVADKTGAHRTDVRGARTWERGGNFPLFLIYYALIVRFFITNKKHISAAAPNTSEIIALNAVPSPDVRPATMYVRNEITAALIAYGSCVETWLT